MNKKIYDALYEADVIDTKNVSKEEYETVGTERKHPTMKLKDIIRLRQEDYLLYDEVTDLEEIKLLLFAKQVAHLKVIKGILSILLLIFILSMINFNFL